MNTNSSTENQSDRWVLQICHSHYPPFLDCARQYAALFNGSEYKILTVYLTGEPSIEVTQGCASDKVVFLGYKSNQVSGLKLGAIKKIRQLNKGYRFKFCIAHRVKPTYVALLATNLPVISVHHNYNDYSRWSRRLLVNFFKARLLMLGVSNSVRDDLRQDLAGWNIDNIQTFYNRIDVTATQLSMLSKEEARNNLNLPQQAWIIGNVGRLHHDKDQTTLIKGFARALPQLPIDSLLVIMGAGPLEPTLKQLVIDLNLTKNIVFTGNIQNAKQYFKAFDLFALTSNSEPFGMVLLEAMAAEIPIICSDCGGGAEIIRDVGQLFAFGSDIELGENIVEAHQSSKYSIVERMQRKLFDSFSDEAARRQFFMFPFVSKTINNTKFTT